MQVMEENLEEKQQNKENLECKASGLSRSGSKTILAKRLPSQKLVSMPTDAQVLLWQQHHMGSEAGKAQFQTTKLVRRQRAKECEAWAKAKIQQLQRKLKGKEAQLQRELGKARSPSPSQSQWNDKQYIKWPRLCTYLQSAINKLSKWEKHDCIIYSKFPHRFPGGKVVVLGKK